jgi:hypothetical protein
MPVHTPKQRTVLDALSPTVPHCVGGDRHGGANAGLVRLRPANGHDAPTVGIDSADPPPAGRPARSASTSSHRRPSATPFCAGRSTSRRPAALNSFIDDAVVDTFGLALFFIARWRCVSVHRSRSSAPSGPAPGRRDERRQRRRHRRRRPTGPRGPPERSACGPAGWSDSTYHARRMGVKNRIPERENSNFSALASLPRRRVPRTGAH